MAEQAGNIYFEYDKTRLDSPYPVFDKNMTELMQIMDQYLQNTKIDLRLSSPSDPKIFFIPNVKELCSDIFDAVKIIKQKPDEELAARLASRLFESFTPFWKEALLSKGLVNHGISFWLQILQITYEWEKSNSVKIHKGTPYFFLSWNYLLIGDIDTGFMFLHNAIQDDTYLGQLEPAFNYPEMAPAYMTATLSDEKKNWMYPLVVEKLRNELSNYLSRLNPIFNATFSIADYDTKFRKSTSLTKAVYNFVKIFFHISHLKNNLTSDLLQNDFVKLKMHEITFGIGLIIDEILKTKSGAYPKTMFGSILWFLKDHTNLINTQRDLGVLIGTTGLDLRNKLPDDIVPFLLTNARNSTTAYDERVYIMLLAYYLRNDSGHNISKQDDVLIKNHNEILDTIIIALFFAINSL